MAELDRVEKADKMFVENLCYPDQVSWSVVFGLDRTAFGRLGSRADLDLCKNLI